MLNIVRRGVGRVGASSIFDQCIFSGTNFVTAVLIGRFAGPSELGTYALCFSIIMLAVGLQRAILISTYVIVRNSLGAHQVRSMRGAILFATAGFAALLGILSILALPIPAVSTALALSMSVALPASLLRDFGRRIAIAELKLSIAILLDAVIAVLQILAIGLLVANSRISTVTALLACSAVWSLVGVVGLVAVRKQYSFALTHVRESLLRLWPIGRWVGLSQVISTAQAFVTPWVMAIAHSSALAGIYAACWTIVQVVSPAIEGLGNILSPSIARNAHDRNWDELRHNVRDATFLFGSMMSMLTIGVAIGGRMGLEFLYGPQYSQYVVILIMLSVAATVNNVGIPANKALVQLGRAKLCFWLGLIGFVISTVMAFLLLALLGEVGAACGLAIGAGTASALRWIFLLRLESEMKRGTRPNRNSDNQRHSEGEQSDKSTEDVSVNTERTTV